MNEYEMYSAAIADLLAELRNDVLKEAKSGRELANTPIAEAASTIYAIRHRLDSTLHHIESLTPEEFERKYF